MSGFLHIVPYANNGGTEKDCYYIIKVDQKHHHEVWVLDTPGPMSDAWESLGVKVTHLNILKFNLIKFGLVLRNYLEHKEFLGILYWSTIRLPLVRYAANEQLCRMAVHVGNPARKGIVNTFKNKILDLFFPSSITTRFFPCSQHVQSTLSRDLYFNTFSSKVSNNPVEIPDYNPHTVREQNENSIIHLGMVARLDPIKDHQTIIQGFCIVLKKFPKAVLHLVGDGELKQELEYLCGKLGVSNSVVFHGNSSKVYEHLQSWDIFVYATTPQEGLGNAVSEALANGLPCILSDLPMLREIIGDTDCAILFEAGNPQDMALKTERLFQNRLLRQTLSVNGYNRARAVFSPERYLKDRMDYLLN